MIIALTIAAAVVLIVGEIFVMAAAGTFKRGLQWSDFVALIMLPMALTSIVASFVFDCSYFGDRSIRGRHLDSKRFVKTPDPERIQISEV